MADRFFCGHCHQPLASKHFPIDSTLKMPPGHVEPLMQSIKMEADRTEGILGGIVPPSVLWLQQMLRIVELLCRDSQRVQSKRLDGQEMVDFAVLMVNRIYVLYKDEIGLIKAPEPTPLMDKYSPVLTEENHREVMANAQKLESGILAILTEVERWAETVAEDERVYQRMVKRHLMSIALVVAGMRMADKTCDEAETDPTLPRVQKKPAIRAAMRALLRAAQELDENATDQASQN